MNDQKKMKNKRVLVTGSGTGIGRGIALEFARQGANVALHYAHSSKGALTAAEEAREMGVEAKAFKAGFENIDEVRQLAHAAIDFLGGIDVLVNNAGVTMNMDFGKVTLEQYDLLYSVNVRAPFFLTQKCAESMIAQGSGVIINISSIHAFEGFPEHSVYAGTKGAIVAQTRELAIELAPKGIRVNCIAAGAVEVENHYKVIPNYDPKAFGDAIPVGFMGKPSHIAKVAVFLASDDAEYIVGQSLIVDGGTTSWMPFNNDFRKPMDASFGKGYVPGI